MFHVQRSHPVHHGLHPRLSLSNAYHLQRNSSLNCRNGAKTTLFVCSLHVVLDTIFSNTSASIFSLFCNNLSNSRTQNVSNGLLNSDIDLLAN
uniref:Uncharacterized protein n=1 Tax=Caenorhabditis japonica TaxID=281687 RepID=A0A8R1ECM6_CAEJA